MRTVCFGQSAFFGKYFKCFCQEFFIVAAFEATF